MFFVALAHPRNMRPPSTHATCAAAILWPLELPQAHFVLMASNSSDGPEVPEAPGVPGSSDGPGVLDEKVGPTYTCSTCREKFYKSAIFILQKRPVEDDGAWSAGVSARFFVKGSQSHDLAKLGGSDAGSSDVQPLASLVAALSGRAPYRGARAPVP